MTAVLVGSQIDAYRLLVVIKAMETHIRTNGRMRLTRIASPANLRAIASEYTGKHYARSRKGLETALADLITLRNEVNN